METTISFRCTPHYTFEAGLTARRNAAAKGRISPPQPLSVFHVPSKNPVDTPPVRAGSSQSVRGSPRRAVPAHHALWGHRLRPRARRGVVHRDLHVPRGPVSRVEQAAAH